MRYRSIIYTYILYTGNRIFMTFLQYLHDKQFILFFLIKSKKKKIPAIKAGILSFIKTIILARPAIQAPVPANFPAHQTEQVQSQGSLSIHTRRQYPIF